MSNNGTSKGFSLDLTDVKEVLKTAALVAASAGLTYLAENATSINLGPATAFVVPVVTLVLNSAVRWMKDYTK